jgi:uncharacterized phage protein (TIGR02218 family)
MRLISDELAAHLAGEVTTLATCYLVIRTDGVTFAATDHDQDIIFDEVTYLSASGYNASDIASKSDMSVDNLEIVGFLSSPNITEADLLAGVWDFADFEIFYVNWQDLTQGKMIERSGKLGEVTCERGQFTCELRGLMQAYTRSIGRIEGPACTADLGDERCQVDLAPFIRTGTIMGVNADGVTLYDPGMTELGPSGGIAITGISNANPAVVTTDGAHGFNEGEVVILSDIVGPAALNAVTVVHNPTTNTFQVFVDTSDTGDYPPYVSGGTATPFGESGYFDGGVMTFTSGANDGLSMEIKAYVPGQFTLQLPMPYPVAVSDTYSASPGCDKSLATCRDRYDNVVHFRGFPYIPGIDKITQVGRHN